jgi:hypothetical protein
MVRSLEALEVKGGAVVVLPERDANIERASANLSNLRVVTPSTLNLLDVLKANHLIFTPAAAEAVTEKLLSPVRPAKTASRVVGQVKPPAPKSKPVNESEAPTSADSDEEAE